MFLKLLKLYEYINLQYLKVMGKNQLEEATKKAAREEKERIARIAERQKLVNRNLFLKAFLSLKKYILICVCSI